MKLKSFLPTTSKGEVAAGLSPFTSLQREIDRVFTEFTRGWPAFREFELSPRTDVTEREKEIRITAELPGLEEKDVKVELIDNVLTISGEKKGREGGKER